MLRKFFIAGTDTGVGKTWISLLFIESLKQAGYEVSGFKPLACGSETDNEGRLRHSDALALQKASSFDIDYSLVNPICLREATAPHIAAKIDNTEVSLSKMLNLCHPIEEHLGQRAKHDLRALVCEGVGGWDVPINDKESMSDFACQLDSEIILVVGLRLGCLNHARLSANIIRSDLRRHGGEHALARFVGFVINGIEPDYPFAQEYIQALIESLPIPLLAVVSHGGQDGITLPNPITGDRIPSDRQGN